MISPVNALSALAPNETVVPTMSNTTINQRFFIEFLFQQWLLGGETEPHSSQLPVSGVDVVCCGPNSQ
jgi:hypothetical protein